MLRNGPEIRLYQDVRSYMRIYIKVRFNLRHVYSKDIWVRFESIFMMPSYLHLCSKCNRRRSKSYHDSHPLNPGETSVAGVCRRCISKESTPLVVEMHHYHYYPVPMPMQQDGLVELSTPLSYNITSELPAFETPPAYTELPAGPTDAPAYHLVEDDAPPKVSYRNKPKRSMLLRALRG